MKSAKKTSLALVPTNPTEQETYYERQISARFENGGGIDFTTRGNSVGEVMRTLHNAIDAVPLNKDRVLTFELCYWHLTEDCDSFELTASSTEADPFPKPFPLVIQGMIQRTKSKFLNKLSRAGITLVGRDGAIPN